MPWTPKQVRYLLSKGSPLSGGQQDKMKAELHADPSLGHKEKVNAKGEPAAAQPKRKQHWSGK